MPLKKLLSFALFLITLTSFGQIKGTVVDDKGNPLPFVNIFEENTYIGTTSNEQGKYELNVRIPGNHTILFQYLGFKTNKQIVVLQNNAPTAIVDVIMVEENFTLKEVVINTAENPANEIIRNAIKNKRENAEKNYMANYYFINADRISGTICDRLLFTCVSCYCKSICSE